MNPGSGKSSAAPVGMRNRRKEGKPKLSFNLLSRAVQEGEARVWESGSIKYTRGNWLIGMPWTECADSVLSHLTAILNGEMIDPDSGLPHADHLVCAAKILSHSYHTRKDLDDRGETHADIQNQATNIFRSQPQEQAQAQAPDTGGSDFQPTKTAKRSSARSAGSTKQRGSRNGNLAIRSGKKPIR